MCDEQLVKEKREPHYTNDYLIVSPTKKMAVYTYKYFRDYILEYNINAAFNNDTQTLLVSSNGFHGVIRFVFEREYFEKASFGFHGWTMSGLDIEEWLDAAYAYGRSKRIFELFLSD